MSSDVYFYRLGDDMWTKNTDRASTSSRTTLGHFGFGDEPGIDLPYEYAGSCPTAAVKAQAGRGQEVISKRGRRG